MKSLALASLGMALLLGTGCAASIRRPVTGSCYLDVKSGEAVGSGIVPAASKTGTARATTLLGLVAVGDASISSAAKAGGIKKISYVDYHSFQVLGIFGATDTIVYGE